MRDDDDDDGPYIIAYDGFVSCSSARVYLTLHRVLAPSTQDTPSKVVSLTGEHFLTGTHRATGEVPLGSMFADPIICHVFVAA